MWSGLPMLLGLSIIMAISSFLAGSLPLSISMSQRHLRLMSAMGTGVLVGTSLVIIIPEGIDALYTADGSAAHRRSVHGTDQDTLAVSQNPNTIGRWTASEDYPRDNVRKGGLASLPRAAQEPSLGHLEVQSSEQHGARSNGRKEPHAWVGVSLIFGFILMYLIDVLPRTMATAPSRPLHISLSNLSNGLYHSLSHSPNIHPADTALSSHPSNLPATTIGLVIHAAADGIALGASSSTSNAKLGLVIFLAILLHKAPAAFGLTSILLKQGLGKRAARTHLIAFSIAAPFGALATWIVIGMLGRDALGDEGNMQFSTGCVLLFSGGTFLYVAMHSMQETNSSNSHGGAALHSRSSSTGSSILNGDADGGVSGRFVIGHSQRKQIGSNVAIMVAGMLMPLLAQVGHGERGH